MESQISLLIDSATKSLKFSYSPYSKFKVGASVLTSNGKIFTGTNIECISFSLTICAERVAIAKAISEGYKNFKAIAIATNKKTFVSPCGACRQFLAEFTNDMDVILVKSKNDFRVYKLSELLPDNFEVKF